MALHSTNFFGRLLQDIITRLKDEVPELKWISEDLGQLNGYEMRPEVAFPCALIEFPSTSYSYQSQTIQRGKVQISITLGFNPYGSANHVAPDISIENSLKRFEIEQKVVNALHGWSGEEEEYQCLSRLQASSQPRNDGMRVRVLQFDTEYEDNSQDITLSAPITTVRTSTEIY